MNQYTKQVEYRLAEEIRNTMSFLRFPDFCGDISNKDVEEYKIVKELSFLVSEFLSNKETKEHLIVLSNKSLINGENNDIKLEFFRVIRDIITHFPFFQNWDDVSICKDMLKWNDYRDGHIINFLINIKIRN